MWTWLARWVPGIPSTIIMDVRVPFSNVSFSYYEAPFLLASRVRGRRMTSNVSIINR